jgi:hypothetical protein
VRTLKKQTYRPKDAALHSVPTIRTLGLDHPEGTFQHEGRSWRRHQVCRQATFSLVAMEAWQSGTDRIGATRQEEYIKLNFWLSGRHTTILDGFGQCDHERPELLITAGPAEMIKVDVLKHDTRIALVALCLLRDFFPLHMGIAPEELPEPLRAIVAPDPTSPVLHLLPLTADLVAATRAILAAPMSVRRSS